MIQKLLFTFFLTNIKTILIVLVIFDIILLILLFILEITEKEDDYINNNSY